MYEWSESRRPRLADSFIPDTPREPVYIRDCTWARPTMRACTELFIFVREKERKREIERERERAKATVLSFASLSSSLSPFFASSFAYSTLFFLARRGKDPCIRLPVLPRSFIFSLFPSACADSMKKRRMKKSRAPWPSIIRTCHVIVEKSVAESRILFEEFCPATGFHAVISETNLLRVMRY